MSKTRVFSKVVPFEKKVQNVIQPKTRKMDRKGLDKTDLLQHFVREGQEVLQGLDNLGNFLMGFGVLILGYLLNVNLKNNFARVFDPTGNELFALSLISLFAWGLSIFLLLGFIYLFVFHLLAGRAIHAHKNDKNSIGNRISIRKMTYQQFEDRAPNFESFLSSSYLAEDQENDEKLWYATFRYTRYMAFRKLMIMNKMRTLLGGAMISGVFFKLVDIFVQSW